MLSFTVAFLDSILFFVSKCDCFCILFLECIEETTLLRGQLSAVSQERDEAQSQLAMCRKVSYFFSLFG